MNTRIPSTEPFILGLPAELRVLIYHHTRDRDDLHIQINGRARGDCEVSKHLTGFLALPLVCRILYQEVKPLVPRIDHVYFDLQDFTTVDLKEWVACLGQETLLRWSRRFDPETWEALLEGWVNDCRAK